MDMEIINGNNGNIFKYIYRHRVMNLFLKSYKEQWLCSEDVGHDKLIQDLTEVRCDFCA